MRTALLLLVALALCRAEVREATSMVQAPQLNASRPYFIPTHPRVTTTIRFPGEIGPPDGAVSVFTEDATQAGSAEYLVTWQQQDSHFTVTPLRPAPMANLNVPYERQTYVFYFYQVADPLHAVASVTLGSSPDAGAEPSVPGRGGAAEQEVERETSPPPAEFEPLTPARLLGFLDRLKILHATPPGAPLESLVRAMRLQVAVPPDELRSRGPQVSNDASGIVGTIDRRITTGGSYELVLLRVARDPRLNCVGFICLLRNTSDHVIAFDVTSFGARAGAQYLVQRVSDAEPILKPGEQAPAYFVVQPGKNSPLSAANDWKLSVDLVGPRQSPGQTLARREGHTSK